MSRQQQTSVPPLRNVTAPSTTRPVQSSASHPSSVAAVSPPLSLTEQRGHTLAVSNAAPRAVVNGTSKAISAPLQRPATRPPLQQSTDASQRPRTPPPQGPHDAPQVPKTTLRSPPATTTAASSSSSRISSAPPVPNLSDGSQPLAAVRGARRSTVTIRDDGPQQQQQQQQPMVASITAQVRRSAAGTTRATTTVVGSGKRTLASGPVSLASSTTSSQSTRPWCPPAYAPEDGHVGLTGSGLLVSRFLIVSGGLRSLDNTALSTVSCFDTRHNRWVPNQQQPSSAHSSSSPPPWSLPEPLYGHCCVTHGQRSVWLVGGVSGSHLSRTIIRLTIDVHFASGTTQAAIPHRSPALFGPGADDPFSHAYPMISSSPPLTASATAASHRATQGGSSGSTTTDDDVATHFVVSSCRYYHLEFPVGFATCVKLQGALNPVALIIGGMSTVRDSDTGDVYPVHQTSPPTVASATGAAVPQTTERDSGSVSQEARRLGITNRVFALNLDDCSIFRVAQMGDVPSPRMMSAAAPLLRRDVSGSYGSIVYFGGVTAPHAHATPAATDRPFTTKSHSKSSSTASRRSGGSNCDHPPPPPAAAVDDSRFVFVASVLHDPKSKTFSLIWTHHKQRSKADPWPAAVAGHSLCPMPGFALLLGGCPTMSARTLPATTENESPKTPLPAHRTLALLYDVTSGVTWSELSVGASENRHSATTSSMSACNQLVYHRAVVVETSSGSSMSRPPSSTTTTTTTAGAITPANSVNDSPESGEHTSTVFVVGGGPSSASTSPHRPGMSIMASFAIPNRLTQWTAPHSDSDDDAQECAIQVHMEIGKQHNSMCATANRPTTIKSGVCDITMERRHVCIDKLVQVVADKIVADSTLRPHFPRTMALPPAPTSIQLDAVRRLVVNNLLLYSRGCAGERVPLSNDVVLDRMVRRAGLNAMPLVASLIPPIKGYRLLAKLGEGSFGRVYSAMNDDTGQFFAVKRVRFIPEQREQLLREIRLLRSLDHPNIVKYLGVEVSEEKQVANIFLEYVKMEGCGDLTSLLRRLGNNPPISIIRCHLRQVLAALTYLHSYHIVHQDIKGANVLVGVEVTKLADFGTARQLVPEEDDDAAGPQQADGDATSEISSVANDKGAVSPRSNVSPRRSSKTASTIRNRRETREGTAVFMAPEVLVGGEHEEMSTASDIWSVGCLLIEMASGKLPWISQLSGDRRDALLELRNRMLYQEKPQYPTRSDFPASGVRFLDDCLMHDPRQRKTAAQLLEHPFLTDELDDDSSPDWSVDAPRCTSPLSGVSNVGGGAFHLGGRQASDLIGANSTLENCVETFEEGDPAVANKSSASLHRRPEAEPSASPPRDSCATTSPPMDSAPPAVRRVVGLPNALRVRR